MQGIKLRAKEHLASVDVIDDYSRCFPVTERGASKTVTGRSINEQGRATRGESVIALRSNDRVIDSCDTARADYVRRAHLSET